MATRGTEKEGMERNWASCRTWRRGGGLRLGGRKRDSEELNTGGGQVRGVQQIAGLPASFRAGVEGRSVSFSVVQGVGMVLVPWAWFEVLPSSEAFDSRSVVAS